MLLRRLLDAMMSPSGDRRTIHRFYNPKPLWWGWRNVWKRPIWLTRGNEFAPDLCEFGIGPISFAWIKWGGHRG